MRIHELVPYDGLDLVIHNEKHGHTLVLTPQGAVFNNEDTLDMTNMSIAFGVLTGVRSMANCNNRRSKSDADQEK